MNQPKRYDGPGGVFYSPELDEIIIIEKKNLKEYDWAGGVLYSICKYEWESMWESDLSCVYLKPGTIRLGWFGGIKDEV